MFTLLFSIFVINCNEGFVVLSLGTWGPSRETGEVEMVLCGLMLE
jgi:hypothetical protein